MGGMAAGAFLLGGGNGRGAFDQGKVTGTR